MRLTPAPASLAERESVERALAEVLLSAPMRSTQQCQLLLRYIVEHSLGGDDALLRERVIGKEVFGRRPDYEPGEDPVVRIRAADLRKRLALYYQALPATPELRIDIPSGSYKATFTRRAALDAAMTGEAHTAETPEPVGGAALAHPPAHADQEGAPAPSNLVPTADGGDRSRHLFAGRRGLHYGLVVLCSFLVLAALGMSARWYRGRSDRLVRAFWAPLLDSPKQALISIGSNSVYRVGGDVADVYGREHHIENNGMEFFPAFAPSQTLQSTGLEPAPDSFVALGDVAAVSEIVATLTHFEKPYQERFPNDVSFAEVRASPTVLIGGFNNPMARELMRNYRFVLASRNRIEDREHPGQAWVLHAPTDSHDTEDYAIVTRIWRGGTKDEEPLVSVAGMGQYGTLAATEFLCRPETLEALIGALGRSWNQNFQVILHVKVVDFKPMVPTIVAVAKW